MSPIISPARYFVYILERPDPDGRPFYVGKGTGNRPYEHFSEARAGNCTCRKCIIIRGILRLRREPTITYAFRTDDEREAFKVELTTIKTLGLRYRLCNKNAPAPVPSTHPLQMTYLEYLDWLVFIDTPAKERKRILEDWAYQRLPMLRAEWRAARLNGPPGRAADIDEEINRIESEIGMVMQWRLV